MIDWNKNGKIDPIDVGISISASDDAQNARKHGGCITTVIIAFTGLIGCIAILIGGIIAWR